MELFENFIKKIFSRSIEVSTRNKNVSSCRSYCLWTVEVVFFRFVAKQRFAQISMFWFAWFSQQAMTATHYSMLLNIYGWANFCLVFSWIFKELEKLQVFNIFIKSVFLKGGKKDLIKRISIIKVSPIK